jgi:hypothetical protein
MEQIAAVKLLHVPMALTRGVDVFMLDLDVGFLEDPKHMVAAFRDTPIVDIMVQVGCVLSPCCINQFVQQLCYSSPGGLHLHHEPHQGGLEDLVHRAAAQHRPLSVQRQQQDGEGVRARLGEVPAAPGRAGEEQARWDYSLQFHVECIIFYVICLVVFD